MKIALAITGASGSIYARLLIEKLHIAPEVSKIGVVFSKNGLKIYNSENTSPLLENDKISIYSDDSFLAPFASGSCTYDGMVICPCSCGTMGRIASGVSDSLITRAADVMLKERRRLILAIRETPLSLIHIKNMEQITLAGGIILPASPSFYSKPTNIEQLADTVVFRILSLLGIKNEGYKWQQE